MIHPELVGTRRSPSVAKGETPSALMSSSKDPPAPNNGHLQNHIGSHCYKYKRDRKQTPLPAPANRTRGFRENRQNNKPFKRPSCPKRRLSVQEVYGITSFSNCKPLVDTVLFVQEVYGITNFSNSNLKSRQSRRKSVDCALWALLAILSYNTPLCPSPSTIVHKSSVTTTCRSPSRG